MLARFLNNWPYKLAAIVIALAIHKYVNGLMNPNTTRIIPGVPITAKNVPDGYLVTNMAQNVTLQVSGPASVLDSLHPDDSRISATVNLRSARNGSNSDLPVSVSLSSEINDTVSVDSISPPEISATIDPLQNLSMHVRVSFARLAPAGYQYQQPVVAPAKATVSGPATQLKQVHELVAYADAGSEDEGALPTTLEGTFNLIPLDDHGAQVEGVTVSPSMAHVTVPIARTAAMKALLVSPSVTGAPAYPWAITGIEARPSVVTVAGPASVLAVTGMASTTPIDVTGAAGTVRRVVDVELPTGIQVLHERRVTVIITLARKPGSPVLQPGGPMQSPAGHAAVGRR
jgi:YbbR domain-containing protein